MEKVQEKPINPSPSTGEENVDPKGYFLWVDWNGAAQSQPVLHANQVIVHVHDHEVFLSFFQISPPILIGTPEEQTMQLQGVTSIRPDCVARINISPRNAKGLIKALQENLDKYEAAQGQDDEETD